MNADKELHIRSDVLQAIFAHCVKHYPEEACGLIVGDAAGVTRWQPAPNVWDDAPQRQRRFLLDPQLQLRLERELDGSPSTVMGSVHSHPDHPAAPSAFDAEAAWPGYWYIIVPVYSGIAGEPRAWVVDPAVGAFVEKNLVVDPV